MGPVNAADGPHAAKIDDTRGGTLGELLLVVASIGVLAVLAAPALVSYWRTSSLQAGARELASSINLGRQLAISRSTTVCVEVAGTNVRLRTGGGDGTIWTGDRRFGPDPDLESAHPAGDDDREGRLHQSRRRQPGRNLHRQGSGDEHDAHGRRRRLRPGQRSMRPAGAMMRPRRHDRGFTLVEVLVATFITTTGLILSRLKHGFESRWGHQFDFVSFS